MDHSSANINNEKENKHYDESEELMSTLQEEIDIHEETLNTLTTKLNTIDTSISTEKKNLKNYKSNKEQLLKKQVALRSARDCTIKLLREVQTNQRKCLDALNKLNSEDADVVDLNQDEVDDEDSIGVELITSELKDDNVDNGLDSNINSTTSNDDDDVVSISSSTSEEDKMHISTAFGSSSKSHQAKTHTASNNEQILNQKLTKKIMIKHWSTKTSKPIGIKIQNIDRCYKNSLFIINNPNLLHDIMTLQTNEIANYNENSFFNDWLVGTCLDPLGHVMCWYSPDRRRMFPWETLDHFISMCSNQEDESLIEKDEMMDPNAVLCPYELTGICLDESCTYQHLSKNKETNEKSNDDKRRKNIIPLLFDLRLPTRDEVISDDKRKVSEEGAGKKNQKRLKRSNEHSSILKDEDRKEWNGEEQDFVRLPPLPSSTSMDSSDETITQNEKTNSQSKLPHPNFWWLLNKTAHSKKISNLTDYLSLCGFVITHKNSKTVLCAHDEYKDQPIHKLIAATIDCSRLCIYTGRLDIAQAICNLSHDHVTKRKINDVTYDYLHKILQSFKTTILQNMSNSTSCEIYSYNITCLLLSELLHSYNNFTTLKDEAFDIILWDTILQSCLLLYNSKHDTSHDIEIESKLRPIYNYYNLKEQTLSKYQMIQVLHDIFDMKTCACCNMMHTNYAKRLIYYIHWTYVGKHLGRLTSTIIQSSKQQGQHNAYSVTGQVFELLWFNCIESYSNTFHGNDSVIFILLLLGPTFYITCMDFIAPSSSSIILDSLSHASLHTMDSLFRRIVTKMEKYMINLNSHDESTFMIEDDDEDNDEDLALCNTNLTNQNNKDQESYHLLHELLLTPYASTLVSISCILGMYQRAQNQIEYYLFNNSIMIFSELLWSQLVTLRCCCSSTTSSNDEQQIRILCKTIHEYDIYLCHVLLSGDSNLVQLSQFGHEKNNNLVLQSRNTCNDLLDYTQNNYFDSQINEPGHTTTVNLNLASSTVKMSSFPLSILLFGKSLLKLSLTHSSLCDLPHVFGDYLSNVEEIDLSYNEISNLPKSFCSLTKLQILNISHNNLQTIPETIGNLTNLSSFDSSYNQIHTIPNSLCDCYKLTRIVLNHNVVTSIPRDLYSRLRLLQELRLEDNPIHQDSCDD